MALPVGAADKVERVDFNSDNAKIDGALHQLAQCNCRMYFTSYTGTGGDGQSLVFLKSPCWSLEWEA